MPSRSNMGLNFSRPNARLLLLLQLSIFDEPLSMTGCHGCLGQDSRTGAGEDWSSAGEY